jgi:hypothetical protein
MGCIGNLRATWKQGRRAYIENRFGYSVSNNSKKPCDSPPQQRSNTAVETMMKSLAFRLESGLLELMFDRLGSCSYASPLPI